MFDFQSQEKDDLIQNQNFTLELLANEYSDKLALYSSNELELESSIQSYLSDITALKDEFGFNLFLNLWISQKENFSLNVQLLNMDTHQRIVIVLKVGDSDILPSLSDIFWGSYWCEQEAWDMFGIEFENIPNERLLSPDGMQGFPLRKDFIPEPFQLLESGQYEFSPDSRVEREIWKKREIKTIDLFGMRTKGPYKAVLEIYDEKIQRGRLEVGYMHRCVEKILENSNCFQALIHLGKLSPENSTFYEQAWCFAVEEHLDVYIPERARALRMMFNEMTRIQSHLSVIRSIAQFLNCSVVTGLVEEMNSSLVNILDLYSEGRKGERVITLGGVSKDIPKGWMTECLKLVSFIEKKMVEVTKQVTGSVLWMERLCRYSFNSVEAISFGMTGPNLRASGVNYDLRKVSPYYFYKDLDFEVPLGIKGECYDRYLVRAEEIFQSVRIIGQLLDSLPLGEVITKDPRLFKPRKQDVYSETDALIQHHKVFERGPLLVPGKIYSSLESANGEFGIHLTADGSTYPDRVKLRTPGFFSAQGFARVTEGVLVDELELVINSLNLIASEIDR